VARGACGCRPNRGTQRRASLKSDFGNSQSDRSALVAGQYQLAMSISVPYHGIEGGVRILALSNPQCRRKVIDGLKSLDRWHAEPLTAEGFEKNPGHILDDERTEDNPARAMKVLGIWG
jgi:hypothetical protein